jgi:hypothetical protein
VFPQGDGLAFPNRKNLRRIKVEAVFDDDGSEIRWTFRWGILTKSNLSERIDINFGINSAFVDYDGRRLSFSTDLEDAPSRGFRARGSILANLDTDDVAKESPTLAAALQRLSEWSSGVFALDLLSPQAIRNGARGVPKHIGHWGENLTSFVASLKPSQKQALFSNLERLYPKLKALSTTRKKAGWIDMQIGERYRGYGTIAPGQVSDGFLRLLAFCCVPLFDKSISLVLLDEIENGIEPHLLPALVELLKEESRQIVVTSHSPLIANIADTAEISVVARDQLGRTRAVGIEKVLNGLKLSPHVGAGEAWVNLSAKRFYDQVLTHAEKQ